MLRKLLERRTAIVTEMRALTAAPSGEAGDLSAEQNTKFETLKTELEGLEKKIQRQQFLDDAERRAQGTPVSGTGDNRLDEACRDFSLRVAIAGAAGLNVDWSREKELSAELTKRSPLPIQGIACPMTVFHQPLEKRTLTSATDGANLIATDLAGNQFIDILRAKLVLRRLGARTLTGLVGNLDIGKLNASVQASWFTETSGLSANDPGTDKISLSPKHVGCLTEIGRTLLLQSSPDIEQLIRSDFAAVLARAIDSAGIQSGGANGPTGLLETAGLDTTTNMNPPTWEAVLSLIEKVQIQNAEGNAFLTEPSVVRKLRSTPRVSGTDSVMIQQDPNSLAGYPLEATTLVLANNSLGSTLIFGNWSDILLAYWSVLDVLTNPFAESSYVKGAIQVRGIISADIGVRHVESFAASENVGI